MLLVGLLYAPTAFANAWEGDNNHKCKRHNYNGVCDFEKPEIQILSPENHSHLGDTIVTITGNAFDSGSGIKRVDAAMKGSPFATVSTHDGGWTFVTPPLSPGWHTVKARAVDNAGNEQWTFVVFKIVPV